MPRGIPNKKPEVKTNPASEELAKMPKVVPEVKIDPERAKGMYVSPIKQRVALTTGDVFLFETGKPQFVREAIRPDMLSYGVMPVDGVSPVEEVVVGEKVEPVGQKRLDAIDAAIEDIVKRNNVKDFAASGIPRVDAVVKIIGFDISEKIRDKHWKENRQRAAAA